MKAVKVIALVLLCVLVALLSVGCAESVTCTVYTDGSGRVHREYLLSYDVSEEDAETVRDQAVLVMQRYVKKKGLNDYAEIDQSQEGRVALRIVFPSVTEYDIWLGYTGREAGESFDPVKKGIVDRYESKLGFYVDEREVNEIRSLTDPEYADFPMDADLYFTYGTTSRTMTSNGERSESDGIYYHTWKIEVGAQPDMVVSYYGINPLAFYSIIILIFVLSLAVIFVIIYIDKYREKRRANYPHGNTEPFDGDPFSDGKKE